MHSTRPDEIDQFKRQINLTEYAAAQGYVLDRKESSRNSAVMRGPGEDKIIVALHRESGHWMYFSVRDERDNGTIIDFIQNRQRLSLGELRKALRPWIGLGSLPPARPPAETYAPSLEPASKDRTHVIATVARMQPVSRHPYLEERNIPPATLEDRRFLHRIFRDARHNAIFPHYDEKGLCGYEIKNRGFTGFSKGGDKGLWISAARRDACRLVIAESGIDALSHAALFPDERARYASIGGKMNPHQPALIQAAIESLPEDGEVIGATDADPDGRKLAGLIETIAAQAGRIFTHHQPPQDGQDWNDVLKACGRAGSHPEEPGL